MSVCREELAVLMDNVEQAVKAGKLEPWVKEAIKKSLTAYVDCADTVLQEFK